jgi:hypothetical protein
LVRFAPVVAAAAFWPERCPAAELRVEAPGDCSSEIEISERVAQLLGRRLAEVPDLALDVAIVKAGPELSLSVGVTERDGQRRVRELSSSTCAEATDAAAVAIAMAVQLRAEDRAVPDSESPEAEADARPTQPKSSDAAPELVVPSQPPAPIDRERAAGSEARWAIAVSGLSDVGTLPELAIGGEGNVALSSSSFRAVAGLGYLPPQTTSGDPAGKFSLVFGSVGACFVRPVSGLRALGCAGYELGYLRGEGVRVTVPREDGYAWHLARIEGAALVPLSPTFGLLARGVMGVPLDRRPFRVDEREVHRPKAAVVRFLIGVEAAL